MKYSFLLCCAFSSLAFAQDFLVMSYNIKLDHPKEGESAGRTDNHFLLTRSSFTNLMF